jgi:hypothetical protein
MEFNCAVFLIVLRINCAGGSRGAPTANCAAQLISSRDYGGLARAQRAYTISSTCGDVFIVPTLILSDLFREHVGRPAPRLPHPMLAPVSAPHV